jgi:hypothetical protein
MVERGFEIPFIGVAAKWERRIERDLRALLAGRDEGELSFATRAAERA